MAEGAMPYAVGSNTHAARVFRNQLAALLGQPSISHSNSATATTRGGCYGVVGSGDLLVTSTGSLGYSIAVGRVAGPGTFALAQGAYAGYNDAAVTGNVSARDATNPRIDYIAWRVRDTDEDATGSEDNGFVVIAGTPASSPTPPSIPSSLGTLVILSEVLVPSSANGGALSFTDRRTFLSAVGGTQRCTSTTRPSGGAVWPGLEIIELDTGRKQIYDGSGWVRTVNWGSTGRTGADITRSSVLAVGNNTLVNVTWDTEAYDTDGYITVPSNTVTIPTGLTGFYLITFRVALTTATTGLLSITAGGLSYDVTYTATVATNPSHTIAVPLGAGQTIQTTVLQQSGSSMDITAGLAIHRVSP